MSRRLTAQESEDSFTPGHGCPTQLSRGLKSSREWRFINPAGHGCPPTQLSRGLNSSREWRIIHPAGNSCPTQLSRGLFKRVNSHPSCRAQLPDTAVKKTNNSGEWRFIYPRARLPDTAVKRVKQFKRIKIHQSCRARLPSTVVRKTKQLKKVKIHLPQGTAARQSCQEG